MPLLDSTNPAASREKIPIPPTPEYGDQERHGCPTAHFRRGCAGEKHYDERDADDGCCTACCDQENDPLTALRLGQKSVTERSRELTDERRYQQIQGERDKAPPRHGRPVRELSACGAEINR